MPYLATQRLVPTLYRAMRGSLRRAPLLITAGLTTLMPHLLLAQSGVFSKATTFLNSAQLVIGVVMVIAGLILMMVAGFAIKEGRGGWGSLAVAVLLVFVGYNVGGLQAYLGA